MCRSGSAVRQEAHTWSLPGIDKVAGIQYTITNHGTQTLRDVRLGVYADLDSRERSGGGGHTDDFVTSLADSLTLPMPRSSLERIWNKDCFATLQGQWPAVHDAAASSKAPWTAVIGMSHTTDPLAWFTNIAFEGVAAAHAAARAPARDTTFQYAVFSPALPAGQGGPPILDADRYAAMHGTFPQSSRLEARDYSVLVSCGPFRVLEPGQSVEFAIAFVAGENPDSLVAAAQWARLAYRGTFLNLQADKPNSVSYLDGATGINGHEILLRAAAGHRVQLRSQLHAEVRHRSGVSSAARAAARHDRRGDLSQRTRLHLDRSRLRRVHGHGWRRDPGALVPAGARAAAAAVPVGAARPSRPRRMGQSARDPRRREGHAGRGLQVLGLSSVSPR
jgi:hypothetical protein